MRKATLEQIHKARLHAKGVKFGRRLWLLLKRNGGKTEICPFCGEYHTHGDMDGHRVPHCRNAGIVLSFTNLHGEIFYHSEGYYLYKDLDNLYPLLIRGAPLTDEKGEVLRV